MSFRKALLILTMFSLVITLADAAEAKKKRRRRHRSRVKRAVINEPVLYERMGGSKVVAQLVDEWVRAAMADGRLGGALGDVKAKPELVQTLRKNLNQQLCEMADGPCQALKPEAKKNADVMAMSEDSFVIFADHLVATMDRNKVREREKNEMLGRIGEARAATDENEESASE